MLSLIHIILLLRLHQANVFHLALVVDLPRLRLQKLPHVFEVLVKLANFTLVELVDACVVTTFGCFIHVNVGLESFKLHQYLVLPIRRLTLQNRWTRAFLIIYELVQSITRVHLSVILIY